VDAVGTKRVAKIPLECCGLDESRRTYDLTKLQILKR